MAYHNATIAIAFLSAALAAAYAQAPKPRAPVIRQVDRIFIESGHPEVLFKLLTEIIQLPVAWPIADQQGSVSGSAYAGNVFLEVFRYAGPQASRKTGSAEARYSAIAFEPYPLAKAVPELKNRGIPYNPPESHISILPGGEQGVAGTIVGLPSISSAGLSIFLYEYSPAFLKVEVRREQLGNRLALNDGGPLGLQSVREIVLGVSDFNRARAEWRKLLGNPAGAGTWRPGTGPMIRLISDTTTRIQSLSLRVKSLERARAFLKKKQLLGNDSAKAIFLKPSRIQGLGIRLVEE